ncbi:MFS transporter [Streptomyces sp. NPDC006978]|uniref:MFS transporter n=1 Tax=Streptomyces sp. NPDC006978 TaxID=3364769 RepID=UPI0036C2A345
MIVIIALGGIFLDAYDLSSLAYGLPDITRQFGLSSAMAGTVIASISVGSLIGALVGGWLVDRIGRYRVFMAHMLFFVVTALVCALAQDVWTLIAARFVMGIGVGMDIPVAIAFLAEFSRLRGKGSKGSRTAAWSPAWYTATSGCYLVIMLLYFVLPDAQLGWLWRFTVGFGAVPAVIVLLLRRRYMNESPTWAADQGDLASAAKILRQSYGVDARVADDVPATAPRPPRPGLASYARLFAPPWRHNSASRPPSSRPGSPSTPRRTRPASLTGPARRGFRSRTGRRRGRPARTSSSGRPCPRPRCTGRSAPPPGAGPRTGIPRTRPGCVPGPSPTPSAGGAPVRTRGVR